MPTQSVATLRTFASGWKERWSALKRLPAVFGIVWEAGAWVVVLGVVLRIASALIPLAMLAVSRKIIDAIVGVVSQHGPAPPGFWGLVALEFGLAILGSVLSRSIDFSDRLLADRFTRHVSVRVMDHASRLDLARYEDPAFYDKLERARVQATDRIGMIQAIGRLFQQVITAGTLAGGIFVYSPPLILVLICAVVPAFIGDSHFAVAGYSLAFQQ